MTRALFVEFPRDKGSWLIDNEYMFGADILVAPLFEEGLRQRDVYLPPGQWIDFQTGKTYSDGWHTMEAGPIEAIMLVREGAMIPQMQPAQNTAALDWSHLELVAYTAGKEATGTVYLPDAPALQPLTAIKKGKTWVLQKGSLPPATHYNITSYHNN
jgi:alpha-D-xyloside xylohydrolase